MMFKCRYGQTGTGKTYTMEGERSPEGSLSWEDVSQIKMALSTLPRVELNVIYTKSALHSRFHIGFST